jgi:hypothetical protein
MLELHLEPELDALLEQHASRTGQSKAEFARRAILDRLEDKEDYEIAVSALQDSLISPAIPFEEVVKSLGMEAEFPPKGAKATSKSGRNRAKTHPEVPVRKAARIA